MRYIGIIIIDIRYPRLRGTIPARRSRAWHRSRRQAYAALIQDSTLSQPLGSSPWPLASNGSQ
jgi:hypothetical protein